MKNSTNFSKVTWVCFFLILLCNPFLSSASKNFNSTKIVVELTDRDPIKPALVTSKYDCKVVDNSMLARIEPIANGLWYQRSIWPGGKLPTANDDVVIPAGRIVTLAGNCRAKTILVNGTLNAVNWQTSGAWINLETQRITVSGRNALMEIGTVAQPYSANGRCVITLTGNRNPNGSAQNKAIMVQNGGSLELHGKKKLSWTNLASTANAGANQITLRRAVNWEVGDEIILTSTALAEKSTKSWEHVDQVKITRISGDRRTLTLERPLRYKHIGGSRSYTRSRDGKRWNVNIYGEVGLLSQHIKIQGKMDRNNERDGFGGHIMVMKNTTAHVENVELYKMGQKGFLGRYPFHWHMGENTARGDYFRNSSVHKSFNRAVTIHGTDYVTVDGIVAYDHIGHGIFFENGGERFNTVRNNLVFVTRRPKKGEELTRSDNEFDVAQNRTPSSYWITNPNNYFENNVAAGTEGTGFWFAFPGKPLAESRNNPYYRNVVPYREPLGRFNGFVAHTCMNGFDLFDQLNDDHSIKRNFGWTTSKREYIDNGLFYGNDQAIYCGLDIGGDPRRKIFRNCVYSDNKVISMLAADIVLENSLFNVNSGLGVFEGRRSFFWFYDGPGHHLNCHFTGWHRSDARLVKESQGVGGTTNVNPTFRGTTHNSNRPLRFEHVKFPNNNPLKGASIFFKDYDGGFTGKARTTIVPDFPLFLDGHEYKHSSWSNAYRSNYYFAMDYLFFGGTEVPDITVQRVKSGTKTAFGYVKDTKHHFQVPVINDQGFIYYYYFDRLPQRKDILQRSYRGERNSSYIVSFKQFGKLSGLRIVGLGRPNPARVNSLNALRNSKNEAYYIDGRGDLFIKRISNSNNLNQYQQLSIRWTGNGSYKKPNVPGGSEKDSDGDGMSDTFETANCRNPNNASDLNFEFNRSDEGFRKVNITTDNKSNTQYWLTRSDNSRDPFIVKDGFNFSGNQVPQLNIRVRSQTKGVFQLFWTTQKEGNFSPSKSVSVGISRANTFETLVFRMNNKPYWAGQRITRLRLDFPPNATGQNHVYIDYIHGQNAKNCNKQTDEADINSLSGNVKVYPNPSNGNFTINFDGFDAQRVEIFGITGQKIYSKVLPVNLADLAIDQDFETGIYMLQIIGREGKSITKRLVIQ